MTKKAKRVRMTGAATHSSRKAREEDNKLYNHAFKWATITYARGKQKKGGLSAKGVTELIKNEFKVELCTRSVQKYVKNECIGVLPQRRGPKGELDKLHYKNLCLAFESFVVINHRFVEGNVQGKGGGRPTNHSTEYNCPTAGAGECTWAWWSIYGDWWDAFNQ